jgi:predicted acetyltransferase
MIEVGGVAEDERSSFVRAFATAFSNVFEQELVDRLLALFDDGVYRAIAAREDGRIVGTALELPLELTVRPDVTVPCRGITWLGVLPTHRRRGVMRALLDDHLAACANGGAVASLLHASNSGLYLSRGYGVATRRARVRLAVPHIAFRAPPPELALRLVEPTAALDACQAVWERCRTATLGFTTWPDPELQWALDELKGFCVFAGDDGYALYRVEREWSGPDAQYRVVVHQLQAATPGAYAALWQYLCGLTHTTEIVADLRPVDEPLQHLVTEPRRVDISHAGDGVWLKPVDRAALCAARGLPDPGVTDEALANLLLGAFTPEALVRGGKIAPGQADAWTSPVAPWSPLDF